MDMTTASSATLRRGRRNLLTCSSLPCSAPVLPVSYGQIDPSFVITHKVDLSHGPEMYATFRDKADGCIKVMLQP